MTRLSTTSIPPAPRRRPLSLASQAPPKLPSASPSERNSGPEAEPERTWNVLLVEDNPGDIRLMELAFRGQETRVRLHVTRDGDEALRFLHREAEHAGAPRPDLVLLDLNLPGREGREVLREVKEDPELRNIPTLILSSSTSADDIVRAYELHANSYIAKPFQPAGFREIARTIAAFWLKTARLPPA